MRILLLAVMCLCAFGADEAWDKVKQVKSGTELRVYKKGSSQPLLVKMDEATDDQLMVATKSEQVAIDREQIDRIDYRPQGGSRVTRENKVSPADPPGYGTPQRGPSRGATTPNQNVSSGIVVGGKPDFELLYRRPTGAPKK
jgi:hypothetical protein